MVIKTNQCTNYINLLQEDHLYLFCNRLSSYFETYLPLHHNSLVIICIGTDRATGDSLGPLVGYKLHSLDYPEVNVYGTLDHPIHAKNLEEKLYSIKKLHPTALILAIDACLGASENVGCLILGEGPIKPGAGVEKNLPSIGDIHITGIVNFSGLTNMVILQNTRLSLVMKMADTISSGIKYCVSKYYNS